MEMRMYSFFDRVANVWTQPFGQNNDDIALRTFRTLVRNPEHDFGRNPADYDLFYVGIWYDEEGNFEPSQSFIANGGALHREEMKK